MKDFQGTEMHDSEGFLIRDRPKSYEDDCYDDFLGEDYDLLPGAVEVELEGSECDLCGWNNEYLRYRMRPDNDFDCYFHVGCYSTFNAILTKDELMDYLRKWSPNA